MFDNVLSVETRPMAIAFASALVVLALLGIPYVTDPTGDLTFENPYYAFAIAALVGCILVSGVALAVKRFG
jgi:peptidoglycan/LPS O-acetylase OafA/YrhL